MKTRGLAFFLLCLLSAPCGAADSDFKPSGDSQVTGQVGVGTNLPHARTEVQMGPSDNYALKVSSQNGAPLLAIDKTGKVGVGTLSAQALIDVPGAGDTGNLGLQLRVGNSSSTTLSSQIIFASTAGFYRHSIRTRAVSSQNLYNSIDFFLWNSSGGPTGLGNLQALSLQAGYSGSTAAVHVMPVSQGPDAELTISNGVTFAGGTIMRAAAASHSSRALKSDITYFGPETARQAYDDVKSLQHARFRYKRTLPGASPSQPVLVENPSARLVRGLIYEDAPESIRGPNKTLIFDYRLMNLELALKEINRKIEEIESQISAVEKARRGRTK